MLVGAVIFRLNKKLHELSPLNMKMTLIVSPDFKGDPYTKSNEYFPLWYLDRPE